MTHTPDGREEELRALHALMETNTLITLVGPGGIGKTWLAKAVLEAHRANGGRGWFCAAERARVDTELIEALETAVESHAPGLTDIETRFERVLTSLHAPGLLVIDNVEQLPDPARLIARVSSTGVTVLLTSRHQLHLDGEQIFPVKGLGAAASALFIRQARIVDPTFDATRPGFDALLESLDGVPLAIELAAGRMGSFTPEDILKRLDLGLADRVSRARPQRQSSIERSHAWSWDM
jgi:predicted ATPase